jgi:hypothetical protein
MTTSPLSAALQACAAGISTAEAGTALLIASGAFLHRGDFTGRFIHHGTCASDGTTAMAAINWDAAITALNVGELPCSGGEQRILRLAASLADGIPVSLSDTVTGLDHANTRHLIAAIHLVSNRSPFRSE